jgi:hypothetical protein
MVVESRRRLEGRIRVAILSHQRRQLPAIMSTGRHARINGIEEGDAPPSAPSKIIWPPGATPWIVAHAERRLVWSST